MFLFTKWPTAAIWDIGFSPKSKVSVHTWSTMAMSNMMLIGALDPKLQRAQAIRAFFYTKWPPEAILIFPIGTKSNRVLVLWEINAYVEYKFDWCIDCKVTGA